MYALAGVDAERRVEDVLHDQTRAVHLGRTSV